MIGWVERVRRKQLTVRWGRGACVAALACVIGGSGLVTGVGVGLAQNETGDAIVAGVQVDGLELGGKSRAQAAEVLRALAERKLVAPLLLSTGKVSVRSQVKI